MLQEGALLSSDDRVERRANGEASFVMARLRSLARRWSVVGVAELAGTVAAVFRLVPCGRNECRSLAPAWWAASRLALKWDGRLGRCSGNHDRTPGIR